MSFLCLLAFFLIGPDPVPQKDADDVYTIAGPERTLEQIEAIASKMKPIAYSPPADRWATLPKTARILGQKGGVLQVLMLGDSIVNDTSRSAWELLLARDYPDARIVKRTVVRGSTGCWWYREPERLKRYVLEASPDLLIIGGISQRGDLDAIREVATKAHATTGCDVLLMSPAFGTVDPRDDAQWRPEPDGDDDRAKLARLAREIGAGFVDMTGAWGRYVRESGEDVTAFKRDVVHANERGEQILGRILAAHLAPPLPRP